MNINNSHHLSTARKASLFPSVALAIKSIVLLTAMTLANITFADEQTSASATLVTITSFEQLSFYPEKNAPALVKALNISKISAQISSTLKVKHALVGDKFKQGELLAELDCQEWQLNSSVQQASYLQLENQQAFLRREVARGKKLYKRQNLGEADFDRRETDLRAVTAQLNSQSAVVASAKLNESRCDITAPFDGVVSKSFAGVGEMLNRGAKIFEMVESNHSEVSAQIALSDITSLQGAGSYYFQSNTVRYPLNARVIVDAIASNALNREARFTFTQDLAISGTSGRLFWIAPKLSLPAHLLQKRAGKYGIFVLESNSKKNKDNKGNNHARFMPLVDAQEGRPISIQTLAKWQGKAIIIDGRHGLVNNQVITVKKAKTSTVPTTLGAQ